MFGRRIKAKTLDGFVALVTRHQRTKITAEAYRKEPSNGLTGPTSVTVGNIGTFSYGVLLTAPGRPQLTYRHPLKEAFHSQYGFADATERGLLSLQALLTAEKLLEETQQMLPGVQTELLGPGGAVMDKVTLRALHADAAKYRVEPVPLGTAS